MQGMSESDHIKLECVKTYLRRYELANENMFSIAEISQHISDDLSCSSGAASDLYCLEQAARNQDIKNEVTQAINLLGISRGKTIIEKRFIGGFAWRKIEKDMNLTRNTCYAYYRASMLILYDLMVKEGLVP